MTKEIALNKVISIAQEIAKTGNISRLNEMFSIADDNEIFVMEDDEFIAVEDDIFYFTF